MNEEGCARRHLPYGELEAVTHLFGVKHARDLEGIPLRELVELAERKASMATEISKGRKLTKYVDVKPD